MRFSPFADALLSTILAGTVSLAFVCPGTAAAGEGFWIQVKDVSVYGVTNADGDYDVQACFGAWCGRAICNQCHEASGAGRPLTAREIDLALGDEGEGARHVGAIFPKFAHVPRRDEIFDTSFGTIRTEAGSFKLVGEDGHIYMEMPRGTRMLKIPPGDRLILYTPR